MWHLMPQDINIVDDDVMASDSTKYLIPRTMTWYLIPHNAFLTKDDNMAPDSVEFY